MLVERMYMALMRLASAALACGLIVVIMLTLNSGQLYPSGFYSPGSGTFLDMLRFGIPQYLTAAISYFIDGTAFLGIVVAWADRRRIWMIALVAVVVIALAFPVSFNVIMMGDFFARHPRIGQLIGGRLTLLIYLLSLVPVALALAFGRLRGGWRTSVRAEADAALEITRSSL